jgi:hypothetical protein
MPESGRNTFPIIRGQAHQHIDLFFQACVSHQPLSRQGPIPSLPEEKPKVNNVA